MNRFWQAFTNLFLIEDLRNRLFFTLALPGLFEGTKDIGWMNVAGDLSYPIYLVHTLVLYVFGGWLLAIGMPSESSIPALSPFG